MKIQGAEHSTLLPTCFRNCTRYSPSTSFPFLRNSHRLLVCLSCYQNDLSPLDCSFGTLGPAPCKISLVEKAHSKQLETMQLLPQQSEVDENSLKRFPICQVPSLKGFNKACLKPLQPRDEGLQFPTVGLEQLPTKAVGVIQDLQWKIWAQTWNGQGLLYSLS